MHLILLIAAGIFLGAVGICLAPVVASVVMALLVAVVAGLVGAVGLIVWGTVSMTDWIVHTLRRLLLRRK